MALVLSTTALNAFREKIRLNDVFTNKWCTYEIDYITSIVAKHGEESRSWNCDVMSSVYIYCDVMSSVYIGK